MQFSVTVNHAVMPVEPFQFYTGWGQAKEANAAIH